MFTGVQVGVGADRPTAQRHVGSSSAALWAWLVYARDLVMHHDAHFVTWEQQRPATRCNHMTYSFFDTLGQFSAIWGTKF